MLCVIHASPRANSITATMHYIQTPCLWIASMITTKNISLRGNLGSFLCIFFMRAHFPSSWDAMYVAYNLSVTLSLPLRNIYVTLFTWWFSFILDQPQRKRLPFSGIIPYAQTPKGFLLFWLFYLISISISNGLPLYSHSVHLFIRWRLTSISQANSFLHVKEI